MAAHPWARPRAAVAPAPSTTLKRVTGTLHDPNTWTVGVVLFTGIVILARHPIAHLIGTEADPAPAPVVATTPLASSHPLATAPLALSAPVPTHAPRDPFRALVSAAGKVLAPQAAPVGAARPAAPAVPASAAVPVAAAPTATCTGATHRVAAGDTLWTIAARAVRSDDTDRVTLAWHRIYAANRTTLGSDPALLQVGEKLCVPSSL